MSDNKSSITSALAPYVKPLAIASAATVALVTLWRTVLHPRICRPSSSSSGASRCPFSSLVIPHPHVKAKETNRRALHWVFKVSNLKSDVQLYESVFGFKVFRHEEFKEGCEASCNGPYSGWWSKTMIGPSSEFNFCLELTYNYGINKYKRGNDLRYICVNIPGAEARAVAKGYELQMKKGPDGASYLSTVDGYVFRFATEAESKAVQAGADPFLYVSLNVENLDKAVEYWTKIAGMTEFGSSKTRNQAGDYVFVGFGTNQTKLQLVQLPPGIQVSHEEAFGRVAFATPTPDVQALYEVAKSTNNTIVNSPITLKTEGKADVIVTILKDVDGNEICFVGEEGFVDLSTTKPGDEVIDWVGREKRIKAQAKAQSMFNN